MPPRQARSTHTPGWSPRFSINHLDVTSNLRRVLFGGSVDTSFAQPAVADADRVRTRAIQVHERIGISGFKRRYLAWLSLSAQEGLWPPMQRVGALSNPGADNNP
jgi:hypothetical protein